jgi:rhamnosyl/mannosyltransferase
VIRVLQVNKFYYPYIGGVEKVVQQISEELLKEPGVQNEVLACNSGRDTLQRTIRGVPVTLAGNVRTILGMPVAPSFPKLFAQMTNGREVVDLHMPFPLAAWSLPKLNTLRTRLVVHYHSDIIRQRWLKFAYGPAFERLLDRADAIVVSSPNLRNTSEMLQARKDKCHVIPFMVSLPNIGKVSPQKAKEVRNVLGVPDGVPVVLYVGRFVYYKGLQFLLEAMTGVDAVLLLVGDGPLKNELKAQAEKLGMGNRVFWKSGVSDDDLAAYYALADVFVLPSCANTEAYGIVQMEALASALPVINTSLTTGVPWVSKDGETGLTVPPQDPGALREAICRILGDSALRSSFKAAAVKRAEDFRPDAVRQATMKLYRGLLTS